MKIVLFPDSLSIPMGFPGAKTNENHKGFTSWFSVGTSEWISVFSTATFRVVGQTIYSTLSFGNVQIALVAHCGVSLPCLFTRGGNSQ